LLRVLTYDKSATLQDNGQSLFTKLLAKKPGDISEYAKEERIEVPWLDVISSPSSITIVLISFSIIVILITLTWFRVMKSNGQE